MIGFKTLADAQRVLAGIRAIEARQRSPHEKSRHHPGFQGAALVEITGGPTSGLHPAKVVAWDDFANDYVDRGAVRFKETGGATLTTGTVCIGVFTGPTADGEYGIYANLAGATDESFDESFWAEITSGPSTGAYSWKQIVLGSGVYADASPAVTGSSNAYPTYVSSLAPYVQPGTQVRMWPSPTQSGKYEFEPRESGFFAEITAGPSSGAYSWKMRTVTAGAWADVAGFTGTSNAYPAQLDGSTPAVEIGTTVWMWRSTSAAFAFQTHQPASYTVPGLVTTGAQTFKGDKTFRCDTLAVIGDGSNDVAFYVGSLGALTVGQVGTDMTVDLLGGNSDAGAGIVSVGGGVSASAYTVRYDLTHAASFHVSLNGSGNEYVGIGGIFGGSAFDAFQYDPTTQIFLVGGNSASLRVSDDVRVDTSGTYWVGSDQGISFTYSVVDNSGGTQSMTWTGGILTDETYTAGTPTELGEILADGGIDGGTW